MTEQTYSVTVLYWCNKEQIMKCKTKLVVTDQVRGVLEAVTEIMNEEDDVMLKIDIRADMLNAIPRGRVGI